jgi:hypothetical protein
MREMVAEVLARSNAREVGPCAAADPVRPAPGRAARASPSRRDGAASRLGSEGKVEDSFQRAQRPRFGLPPQGVGEGMIPNCRSAGSLAEDW